MQLRYRHRLYPSPGQRQAFIEAPDPHTIAALSQAVTSSGVVTRFETHELIESDNLAGIAERARGIVYTPPGA